MEKRKAVENEDYDLAKVKKDQMEEYRMKIYQQLQKYNLLEHAGVSSDPDSKTSPLRQSLYGFYFGFDDIIYILYLYSVVIRIVRHLH